MITIKASDLGPQHIGMQLQGSGPTSILGLIKELHWRKHEITVVRWVSFAHEHEATTYERDAVLHLHPGDPDKIRKERNKKGFYADLLIFLDDMEENETLLIMNSPTLWNKVRAFAGLSPLDQDIRADMIMRHIKQRAAQAMEPYMEPLTDDQITDWAQKVTYPEEVRQAMAAIMETDKPDPDNPFGTKGLTP